MLLFLFDGCLRILSKCMMLSLDGRIFFFFWLGGEGGGGGVRGRRVIGVVEFMSLGCGGI